MDFEGFKDLVTRQRAIRKFDTSREVPDSMIEAAVRVAEFAPNGGNRQPWRFIVIRSPETKLALETMIFGDPATAVHANTEERTTWDEVPALIAVCALGGGPGTPGGATPASIIPSVQNLLLALHAQGLGGVLTTRWKIKEADVKGLLGIPEDYDLHVIVPVGWPDRKYGRGNRVPAREVMFADRFGQPWPSA
jgi:nitroreductase